MSDHLHPGGSERRAKCRRGAFAPAWIASFALGLSRFSHDCLGSRWLEVFRRCLFSVSGRIVTSQITASSLCWTGQQPDVVPKWRYIFFTACLPPTSSNLSQGMAKVSRDPASRACLGFGKVLIDKATDFEAKSKSNSHSLGLSWLLVLPSVKLT